MPEWPEIAERWQRAAATARCAETSGELDIPYGPHERHRYDLFPARHEHGAAIYLHGGYWQDGDRTLYSFLAEPLTAAGVTLAIPSYRLAPSVTLPEILEDVRAAHDAIAGRLSSPPLLIGHSAGAHLAAALLATGAGGRAVTISGVFDLVPLLATTINDALGLTPQTARTASPRAWPPPQPGTSLLAACGELESAEFHRQSRELAAHWRAAGVDAEYLAIPGSNHFTVIDELARSGSPLQDRVLALAR